MKDFFMHRKFIIAVQLRQLATGPSYALLRERLFNNMTKETFIHKRPGEFPSS